MLIGFPHKYTELPEGPVSVNYGHPLSDGMTGLWLFNENMIGTTTGIGGPYNLISNTPTGQGFGSSTQYAWTRNARGKAIALGSTANVSLTGASAFQAGFMFQSQVTIVLIMRVRGAGEHRFGITPGGGASDCSAYCPYSDNIIYWDFGGTRVQTSALTWGDTPHLVGLTAGPLGQTIYFDGTIAATSSTPILRTPHATLPFDLTSGSGPTDYNFLASFAVQWTPTKMMEWMASPFAMIQPRLGARTYFLLPEPVDEFTIVDSTVSPQTAVARDILQNWNISEQLNERGTMRFGVKSMDASYRPLLREQIDFHWAGQHFFAGHIHHTDEGGLGGYGVVPIVTQCGATDFNALLDRRQIAITLPAGTLKSQMELIEPYLTPFGTVIDPAQVDGPTMPELTFTLGSLKSLVDKLSLASEWASNINYDNEWSMFAPGTEAAPFDIEDNDARVVGDVRVSPTTVDYANRIIVQAGTGTADVADNFVGDGVEDTFELNYNLVSSYGYVTVNAVAETLGPGATWEYDIPTNSITRTLGPPANLDAIVITFVAQFPFEVIAEDVPAQDGGANLIEKTIPEPLVFDAVTAQALADGYLVRSLVQPREVRYRTRLHGLHPGMQQQIQVTGRNVDGPCLITGVDISPEGSALYNYDITAVEGLIIVPSYQDAWRTLAGRVA